MAGFQDRPIVMGLEAQDRKSIYRISKQHEPANGIDLALGNVWKKFGKVNNKPSISKNTDGKLSRNT